MELFFIIFLRVQASLSVRDNIQRDHAIEKNHIRIMDIILTMYFKG